MTLTRRRLTKTLVAALASRGGISDQARAQTGPDTSLDAEGWMTAWMSTSRAPKGALHVSRFVEPIYFLTQPIAWTPNEDQSRLYRAVEVPKGFVTDFASIPRIFWSLLRPDGEYTYPAIIHDYLYWTQTLSREAADSIFLNAMQDFKIDPIVAAAIYGAVRIGGERYWKDVPPQKQRGERRVLTRFPEDPRTRWSDWKRRPDVFG